MSDSVLTIISNEYDLQKVEDVKTVMLQAGFPTIFPLMIPCICGKSKLIVRSLDDFPYKSKKCTKCGCYFIKLVKVTDGKEQIL